MRILILLRLVESGCFDVLRTRLVIRLNCHQLGLVHCRLRHVLLNRALWEVLLPRVSDLSDVLILSVSGHDSV